MGEIYSITCRNKECKYHKTLRSGVGMFEFARMKEFEKDILQGEIKNADAFESLNNGSRIMANGVYLCSQCREFVIGNKYYFIEDLTYSPYGTPRYDVAFHFGKPHCEICGSELDFVRNILSSKVKCPRCNGELISKLSGHFD